MSGSLYSWVIIGGMLSGVVSAFALIFLRLNNPLASSNDTYNEPTEGDTDG